MRTLALVQIVENGMSHNAPMHGLHAGYGFLALFAAVILALVTAYMFVELGRKRRAS